MSTIHYTILDIKYSKYHIGWKSWHKSHIKCVSKVHAQYLESLRTSVSYQIKWHWVTMPVFIFAKLCHAIWYAQHQSDGEWSTTFLIWSKRFHESHILTQEYIATLICELNPCLKIVERKPVYFPITNPLFFSKQCAFTASLPRSMKTSGFWEGFYNRAVQWLQSTSGTPFLVQRCLL